MIKANKLKKGDKVTIISLSRGILGEDYTRFQLNLGLERLKELGVEPVFTKNALKGLDYLDKHPEKRAEDLKEAFADDSIKAIICAIGGDDTYRTIPCLLNDKTFVNNVKNHPKIFMGFSDSTINHLMFFNLGLTTFYGPSFLNDLAETRENFLPYTKQTINELFDVKDRLSIYSSEDWYEERTDFSKQGIETPRISHIENKGYQVLRGSGKITGKLFGGCIESLSDLFLNSTSSRMVQINNEYSIFPESENLKNIILFIETSEDQPSAQKYEKMVQSVIDKISLKNINAIMVGKPQNEKYFEAYKDVLLKLTKDTATPIIYNMNFGHAYPRAIIPYGLKVEIDFDNKNITILEKMLND